MYQSGCPRLERGVLANQPDRAVPRRSTVRLYARTARVPTRAPANSGMRKRERIAP